MELQTTDMRFFHEISAIKPDSGTHAVVKGRLDCSDDTWICKKVERESVARFEVLSQEFHRLMNPGQPETRVAKDINGHYFVLSKEVVGGRPLPFNQPQRFSRGVYTGLGQILVTSVFLNEIDLNTGNLLINRFNKVIKLDGDWSMAALTHAELLAEKAADITPALLSSLPYLPGYFAYNWLDIRRFGVDHISQIFDDGLLSAQHYKAEIHQAILQILLLPKSYMNAFIASYLPAEEKEVFMRTFLLRQAELKESAMQLDSFREYLASSKALDRVQAHFENMQVFAVNQCFPVLKAGEHELFVLEFDALRKEFIRKMQPSPDTVACDLDNTQATSALALNRYRQFQEAPSTGNLLVKRSSTCSDLSGLTANF